MSKAPAAARRPARAAEHLRYTIDASVFVNAFNPHEAGHAASLQFLADIQEHGNPVIVPTLLVPEIAAAVARAIDDTAGAFEYASAAAGLPNVVMVPLTSAMAAQAADLAATDRLRVADAVYLAVARRYATSLVSRDREQRTRFAGIVTCQTPEEALISRRLPAVRRARR